MKKHILKSWPEFFQGIISGIRTHELRRNDRGYQVADLMELREFDPKTGHYTGRTCDVRVTSMTSSQIPCAASREALHEDFCILSVRKLESPEPGDA